MPKPEKSNHHSPKGKIVSFYISPTADELLWRVAQSTHRSRSEIVSLLIESYGPDLLVEKGDR